MIIKRVKNSRKLIVREILDDKVDKTKPDREIKKSLEKDFVNRDINVKKFFEKNYDRNHSPYEAGVSRFKIDKEEGFNGFPDKIQIGKEAFNPITKKVNLTKKKSDLNYEEDDRTPYKFLKNKD